MGRGGTDTLWSSGMTCCCADFINTTNREEVVSDESTSDESGVVRIVHNTDLNRARVPAPFSGVGSASELCMGPEQVLKH